MNRTTPFTPTKTLPRYSSGVSPNRTIPKSQSLGLGDETDRLSGTKFGQDSQIRDIKSQMDSKYERKLNYLSHSFETQGWKNRWQNAEAKKTFLESENIRLIREIEFWKGKDNFGEAERQQILFGADQNRVNQLESVRQLIDAQNEYLILETQRLRGLLDKKIEECNQIRANLSKLEVLNQENASKQEVVQDYEVRIERLKGDYADKMREVEELKVQRARLEQETLEAEKAQRQADSLKNLLEAKREENQRIRQDKQYIQGEVFKSKQVESVLLEKEAILKNELQALEQKAISAEETRKAIYLEKVTNNQATQDQIKKFYFEEQTNLEDEIEQKSKIAASRVNEANNLKRSYHELVDDLAVAEEESNIADVELREQQERVNQAERLKASEIFRATKARDSSINQVVDETLREKRQLEEKLNNLNQIVAQRGNNLSQAQQEAALTEQEKRILEGERAQLLAQLNILVRKQEDNEQRFLTALNSCDNINQRSLERMNREHDNEKRRVNNQINALRNVIDQKKNEAERSRREGNEFCLKLVNCEKNAKSAEAEAQYWRNQTGRVIREKSIEYETERSLTQSQLRDLNRVQSIEKIQKKNENEQLKEIIDIKDREALQLRNDQIRTASQLARDRTEANLLLSEAEMQRQRAIETESSKILELRAKNSIHNDHVNTVVRSGIQQQNALRNEVNSLSNVLIQKELSAKNWRENYSRLSTSPFRKY